MKLTLALLFKINKQPPMRRLVSGRHRIPRIVDSGHKMLLLRELAREEENLFYLSQPYLTAEQEKIWLEKERQEQPQIIAQKRHEIEVEKMYKHVSYDERLEHLRVMEAWE